MGCLNLECGITIPPCFRNPKATGHSLWKHNEARCAGGSASRPVASPRVATRRCRSLRLLECGISIPPLDTSLGSCPEVSESETSTACGRTRPSPESTSEKKREARSPFDFAQGRRESRRIPAIGECAVECLNLECGISIPPLDASLDSRPARFGFPNARHVRQRQSGRATSPNAVRRGVPSKAESPFGRLRVLGRFRTQ